MNQCLPWVNSDTLNLLFQGSHVNVSVLGMTAHTARENGLTPHKQKSLDCCRSEYRGGGEERKKHWLCQGR